MENQIRRDRKYKVFWGTFLLGSIFFYFEHLTGAEWAEFSMYLVGLYMLGNGIQAGANAYRDKKDKP